MIAETKYIALMTLPGPKEMWPLGKATQVFKILNAASVSEYWLALSFLEGRRSDSVPGISVNYSHCRVVIVTSQ